MGWLEAIKAAIISIPKILDLGKDLITRLDRMVEAIQEKKAQEFRNEQHFAALQTLALKVDQDRADMAKRLALLEQRH